jgi:aspartyl-tRNA(Asn)/glutamyl-tRNA(Gln) amidotransferase subunit A
MPPVSDDTVFLSAARQAVLIRDKQLSPVELVRAYLERIDRFDGRLRAYITVCREAALAEAQRAETAVMRGETLGPLHGVTYAVKDQFATRGIRTTAGSRLMADHVPDHDATVITRLTGAGGILLGKLNLTEFALGGTIEFPFGQPRNPWNTEHDTGGSSAGSGAAVAAALCGVSLGEDTGGSVRSPAIVPRGAWSRATAASRWRGRSISRGRSGGAWRTARCCSASSPATIRMTRSPRTVRCPTTSEHSPRASAACAWA